MFKPDICIHHYPCPDGMTAAYLVWKKWGDSVEFVPANYNKITEMPEMEGKNILITDFSFSKNQMDMIIKLANHVVVLDHHKTAEAAMADFETSKEPVSYMDIDTSKDYTIIFNMDMCGATMTEKFCDFSNFDNSLMKYIQDRDIWTKLYDETAYVFYYFSQYEMNFENWDTVFKLAQKPEGLKEIFKVGEAINKYSENKKEYLKRDVKCRKFLGYDDIPVVNAPYFMASDLAGDLAEGKPFAVTYSIKDNDVNFSLRSREDGEDVSEIAQKYGGGGHAGASGMRMTIEEFLKEYN